MKSAIVTGANGFLGSALVNYLAECGCSVFAIVHSRDSDISRICSNINTRIIYCDVQDIPVNVDCEADCFFHFAWEGSAGNKRADEVVQVANIDLTCKAVRAAKQSNCRRFIFASSIMEYEYTEADSKGLYISPNSIYSVAKLTARKIGTLLAASLQLDFIPVIISNVYGEGENSARLINITIKKMLNGEKTSFTDGNQMYDFIYIKDAVCALTAIAEKGKPNTPYYLGSTCPKPLKHFLIEMHKSISPESEFGLGEVPFTGVSLDYYELFDIDAVKNDTGFSPRFSFSEGIENTAKYIKEQLNNAEL